MSPTIKVGDIVHLPYPKHTPGHEPEPSNREIEDPSRSKEALPSGPQRGT